MRRGLWVTLLTLPPRCFFPSAVGCTVEHEDPRDIQTKIDEGEIVW